MAQEKKTILILANHGLTIYKFRMELVERLVADGHDVHVSCPYVDCVDKIINAGCKHHDIKISRHGMNPLADGMIVLKYVALIRKIRPDIIFSYTIKPNIYGAIACRLCGVPCVANITGLGSAVEKPGIAQKIAIALYRIAFKKVQRIFFQNTENRQFFIDRNIYPDKHALLPGSGVNLDRFSPLPYPSEDEGIHLAYISRVMREKGFDEYIAAAKYFLDICHSREGGNIPSRKIIFHVCGFCEQGYQSQLDELLKDDVIVYHGMVDDIREILAKVHCTIHPSFYPEGMSNVLLESSACARPIITTDRSGCREVIEDGVNGFIVKQRDSSDLIEKIKKFIALSHVQKMQMGIAGRAKVEKEFNRQIVVDAYLKEMESI